MHFATPQEMCELVLSQLDELVVDYKTNATHLIIHMDSLEVYELEWSELYTDYLIQDESVEDFIQQRILYLVTHRPLFQLRQRILADDFYTSHKPLVHPRLLHRKTLIEKDWTQALALATPFRDCLLLFEIEIDPISQVSVFVEKWQLQLWGVERADIYTDAMNNIKHQQLEFLPTDLFGMPVYSVLVEGEPAAHHIFSITKEALASFDDPILFMPSEKNLYVAEKSAVDIHRLQDIVLTLQDASKAPLNQHLFRISTNSAFERIQS